jgi:hypothetical protein
LHGLVEQGPLSGFLGHLILAADVFLWSCIKDQVYHCPPPQLQILNELQARIVAAVAMVMMEIHSKRKQKGHQTKQV